jgi:hypothetical protein
MWASSTYIVLRWATLETRRWATPRDQPFVGHPSRPLLGHSRSPSGTRAPSVEHLSASVGPIHPSLGTRPGVRLPCSPSGYRGPPWSLRRATPSDIELFSSASLFTAVFIHFPKISSTVQRMHPLSRECIHFPEN